MRPPPKPRPQGWPSLAVDNLQGDLMAQTNRLTQRGLRAGPAIVAAPMPAALAAHMAGDYRTLLVKSPAAQMSARARKGPTAADRMKMRKAAVAARH